VLLKNSTKARPAEAGSALMAVVAVTAITMLIAIMVTTMSANALSVTVSTRATVQAEAAAAGGVDETLAALRSTAGCTNGGAYSSATSPAFRSQTSHSVDGSNWSEGCPTPTSTKIMIVSSSSDAARTVEAVYDYIPPGTAAETTGASVYSYASGVMNDATLVGSDLQLKTGSLDCTSGSVIDGDVLVAAGNASIQSDCVIGGSLTV